MNQTTPSIEQKELTLQKTTIVKLDVSKVRQLIVNNQTTLGQSASTLPNRDPVTVTTTLI